MKTRSKVLVAAAAAAALGAAVFAGAALADPQGSWRGWHMGGGMGMHDGYGPYGMMGRDRGYGPQGMMGMHEGYGRYGMGGRYAGWGRHGMKGMRERIRDFADRYDTNKDGKITQDEIDAARSEMFKKYDSNGDGKLAVDEYQNLWLAEHRRKMVRAFQHLDVDGTGAIDLKAYNARLGNIVEMLDQNDDGALSLDDMKAWREQHRRGGWNMMPGKGQGRMPMMDDSDDDDSSAQGDQSQQ